MKTFKPSQELINILLQHGFAEDTAIKFRIHAKRLEGQNYDPYHVKRHFSFPGTAEKIYFDYINMHLPTSVSTSSLNVDELKSLITFCHLSSSDRQIIKNELYKATTIHKLLKNVKESPEIYSRKAFSRAKDIFESLSFNI